MDKHKARSSAGPDYIHLMAQNELVNKWQSEDKQEKHGETPAGAEAPTGVSPVERTQKNIAAERDM